jgi:hypothetical protein
VSPVPSRSSRDDLERLAAAVLALRAPDAIKRESGRLIYSQRENFTQAELADALKVSSSKVG